MYSCRTGDVTKEGTYVSPFKVGSLVNVLYMLCAKGDGCIVYLCALVLQIPQTPLNEFKSI